MSDDDVYRIEEFLAKAALREREQQLREKNDENKELRRLLDEVGLDRAGIAGELSAVEQQLREAREALERAHDLLRRLAEWDALTVADQWPLGDGQYWKRLIELERDASAAALGEGAKG